MRSNEDSIQILGATNKSLRVFVAHSSEDKHLAVTLKYFLEIYFGFEVFIAHEDIVPSTDWEVRIKEELESTDVLLGLISPNFKTSDWTGQEVGIALALNKHIVPIKLGINPFGFLYKIHALTFPEDLNTESTVLNNKTISDWVDFCTKIVKAIKVKESLQFRVRGSIIKAFRNSNSFKTAEITSRAVVELGNLYKEEVNLILESYIENSQINNEKYNIPYFVDDLIQKYEPWIQPALLSEVKLYRNAVGQPKSRYQ